MEIDNELIYVIKINGQFQKIKGKDIMLSLDEKNKDLVIMYDKDSNLQDIEQAMKSIRK